MKKLWKQAASLLIVLLLTSLTASVAQAAPDTVTMKLHIRVDEPQFWNTTFYIRDKDPELPSFVTAEWSLGMMGKNVKSEIVIPHGKLSGEISITTEKGSLVNLDVFVKGVKKATLGNWGMQVVNKGQTETVVIVLPVEIKPEFMRSDM